MFDEKEILEFWEKNKVFDKSVSKRKGKKHFVFFEGPPTANGVPGVHHVEARAFKDVVLRYKTMRGYYAPRRAGWDTHGLPVEVEVEKTLGLKNKKDIEKYGVAVFNKKCRESVWKYKELWEDFTKRMGFWIDMAHPYITYENSYIESLWWVIKEFAKKKYLYEDYKVVPWCARCGTALSSHELAQGYEKIKEDSVYVRFKVKSGGEWANTSFLVWTTTPWTLPGNVALAVNPKIGYVMLEVGGEKLIVAESRMGVIGKDCKILKKFKGSELIGLQYEPLYPFFGSFEFSSYKIVSGDFVSTEDGSGIVHIAPAFGDDDFRLSQQYQPKLPVLVTTDQDGLMRAPGKPWDKVWFKKADPLIVEDLKSRGLLFKTESYEHDYPFCWRCKNPLMYLARKTWWVDVNAVRPQLLANNQKINWLPPHLKGGRMGEWLKEKKNWAFSRERYWGTPFPVWKCGQCKKWEAIGSIDELKKRGVTSGNKYFMMRHGESETNVRNITNSDLKNNHYHLTARGRAQAEQSAKLLKKKPDLIFVSPFLRTKETADLIAQRLGVGPQNIKIDPRLSEIDTGIFSEGDPKKYHAHFKNRIEKFVKAPPRGESLADLKKRVFEAILEIETRYKSKNILIVSHEYPLWMLWTAAEGKTNEESVSEKLRRGEDFLKTAEFEELDFYQLPRDENLILDLHKPYIDEIKLKCAPPAGGCGGEMQRVLEVVDVWFDSGAMPFAQIHWPFSKKIEYPADYISEAIDQTRGWFYSLLAISTLLGKGISYKNVITTGLILDSKGKKMSKSLGNVVDPMGLIEKYGADATRWYFFTINQPWDSKLFKEEDVKDAERRFFMILWNVLQFWKLYAKEGNSPPISPLSYLKRRGLGGRDLSPKLLINQWVFAKLRDTTHSLTKKLDAYDIVGAARELENFVVEDISHWYIRRIRDVMKENSKGAEETGAVLAYLLGEVSKLLAPFAPFTAEKVWIELSGKGSVHLVDWPAAAAAKPARRLAGGASEGEPGRGKPTPQPTSLKIREGGKRERISFVGGELLSSMQEVRKIVGLALEARAKSGVKVRQPLSKLEIRSKSPTLLKRLRRPGEIRNDDQLLNLIKDEVNVKEIKFNPTLEDAVRLDTNITSELREEGILRDLIREIQAARKTAGLKPKDKVTAQISLPKEIFSVARKNQKIIEKETNLKSSQISEAQTIKILFK